jgi:hypothetical protein
MGDVYSQATKVVIWLGDADVEEEATFEVPKQVGESYHISGFRHCFDVALQSDHKILIH